MYVAVVNIQFVKESAAHSNVIPFIFARADIDAEQALLEACILLSSRMMYFSARNPIDLMRLLCRVKNILSNFNKSLAASKASLLSVLVSFTAPVRQILKLELALVYKYDEWCFLFVADLCANVDKKSFEFYTREK